MNNSFNQKKIDFIINIAYISVIIILIYIFLKFFLSLIMPFAIGIILSLISEPLTCFIFSKTKLNRSVCTIISITFTLGALLAIIAIITIVVCSQIDSIFSFIPQIIKNVSSYANDLSSKPNNNFFEKALIYVVDYINNVSIDNLNDIGLTNKIMIYMTDIFKSLPHFIISAIVTFAFSIFFSSSYLKIKKEIKQRFSYKKRIILHNIKKSIINVLVNFIKSYSILMLLTFVELSIAFLIFDIQPSIPLALMISLVDILPILGIGTIMIPWGIICLLTGNITLASIIFSIYAVITVIRQIVEPKIVGKNIGLPPIITLPAMFIGMSLFGIKGLFISPMIVTIVYDLNKNGFIKLWNKY